MVMGVSGGVALEGGATTMAYHEQVRMSQVLSHASITISAAAAGEQGRYSTVSLACQAGQRGVSEMNNTAKWLEKEGGGGRHDHNQWHPTLSSHGVRSGYRRVSGAPGAGGWVVVGGGGN
jgi:hypothetical protein